MSMLLDDFTDANNMEICVGRHVPNFLQISHPLDRQGRAGQGRESWWDYGTLL